MFLKLKILKVRRDYYDKQRKNNKLKKENKRIEKKLEKVKKENDLIKSTKGFKFIKKQPNQIPKSLNG